ncbi:MAG: DUF6705 family protein [Bacteroidota bacterium]
MKSLSYLVILVFLTTCRSSAQEIDWNSVQFPDYYHFAGTWVGTTDGSDSLIVKLEVVQSYLESYDRYFDQLAGQYSYYKHGQLVESSFSSEEQALSAGGLRYVKGNSGAGFLSFLFRSYPDDNWGRVTVWLTEKYPDEGVWELSHRNKHGMVRTNDQPKRIVIPFNIPTKITLRKVET